MSNILFDFLVRFVRQGYYSPTSFSFSFLFCFFLRSLFCFLFFFLSTLFFFNVSSFPSFLFVCYSFSSFLFCFACHLSFFSFVFSFIPSAPLPPLPSHLPPVPLSHFLLSSHSLSFRTSSVFSISSTAFTQSFIGLMVQPIK